MATNLQVQSNISSTPQYVQDASSNNSSLAISNGNIGIGTTSPRSKLHIESTSSADGMVTVLNPTEGGEASMSFDTGSFDTTKRWVIGVGGWNSTDKFVIGRDTSPKVTVDTSGNVGIGVTNPGEKLEVNGKIKCGDNIVLNGHYLSGDGGNEGIYVDNDGKVGIGITNPAAALEIKKSITAASGIAKGVNIEQSLTCTADFDILTAMRIKPTFSNGGVASCMSINGLIVEKGNVGIGVTDPTYQLHVVAQDNTAISGAGNPMGAIFGETALENSKTIYGNAKGAGGVAIFGYADVSSAYAGYFYGGKGIFVSGNICSEIGSVGIGTTSPQKKLHVYGGDACIENNLDGEANFRIKNSNAASGGAGTIALEFDSNDANNTRILQTNGLTEIGFSDHFQIRKRGAGTPNLYIDNGASSGNVGIGNTSPDEKLHVSGGNVKVDASYGFMLGSVKILSGANTPEGAVTAPVGSLFLRTNGGSGTTFYVKESGTGNTGWVAK